MSFEPEVKLEMFYYYYHFENFEKASGQNIRNTSCLFPDLYVYVTKSIIGYRFPDFLLLFFLSKHSDFPSIDKSGEQMLEYHLQYNRFLKTRPSPRLKDWRPRYFVEFL